MKSLVPYFQASCHCTPLRMCWSCKKWLKPKQTTRRKGTRNV